VLSVNEFGAEQLGYTVEELVGQSVLNVFHQGDQKAVKENLALSLKTPKQINNWKFRKVCKDKTVIWVKETVRIINGNKGEANFLVVCEDITERKMAEEELKLKSQELEELTQDLRKLSTQLSEQEELSRKKFARILHEQVGQNLAALKIICIDIMNEYAGVRPKMKDVLSSFITTLDDTIGSTRKLTSELYPVVLDALGLVPAVSWYGDLVLKPKKINILIHIDHFVENLSSEYKLSLFRIIQEAFHNIIKHASATEVKIELKKLDGSIRLTIKDNGIGCDMGKVRKKESKGIGIMLMKERALSLAGQFKFKSDLNRGTKIMINIPL
jgi:two-component system sensor histidine kinase UhpB